MFDQRYALFTTSQIQDAYARTPTFIG